MTISVNKLNTFKKQELVDMAEELGVAVDGTKEILAKRVSEFTADAANAAVVSANKRLAELMTPTRRSTPTSRVAASSTSSSSTPSRGKFQVGSPEDDSESEESDSASEESEMASALRDSFDNAKRAFMEEPSEIITTLKRVPSQAYLKSKRVAKKGKKSIVKRSNKLRNFLSTFYSVPGASMVLELGSLINGAYSQSWSRSDSVWWGFTPFATWLFLLVLLPTIFSYYMNYTKGSKRVSFDPLTFAITRAIILYAGYSVPTMGLPCFGKLGELCTFLQVSIPHMQQSIGQMPYISSLVEVIIIIAARH